MIDSLRRAGVPMSVEVEIVSTACTPRELSVTCTLGQLPKTLRMACIVNPAVIFVRWSKTDTAVNESHYAALKSYHAEFR